MTSTPQSKTNLRNVEPEVVAAEFYSACRNGRCFRIIFHQGEYRKASFYYFEDGHFQKRDDAYMATLLTSWLQERYSGIKRVVIGDMLQNLKALASVESVPGQWLVAPRAFAADWKPVDLLFTKTQIINLEARRLNETHWKHPATPAFFNTHALAVEFDEDAEPPHRWLSFLDSAFGSDRESVSLLQQWLGYLLTQDNRQEKMLFLVGPTRSGKGVVASAIEAIIGANGLTSVSLNDLGEKFSAVNFVDKTAAIIGDARLRNSPPEKIIEFLLSTTGNDLQTMNVKHGSHVQGRLGTRLTLAANELPRFEDKSRALEKRLLAINFTKSMAGSEDRSLKQAIRDEATSILRWAVDGFDQLREQGTFTEPRSSKALRDEFSAVTSPVSAFVECHCRFDAGATVTMDALLGAFNSWRESRGESNFDKGALGKDIRQLYPFVDGKRSVIDKSKQTVYRGIGLKETVELTRISESPHLLRVCKPTA